MNDAVLLEAARKIMTEVVRDMWCCGDGHGRMCVGCHRVMPKEPNPKHADDCYVRHAQVWLQRYARAQKRLEEVA